MSLARRNRHNLDIWPGFVDALATLLMVIIFLLSIFIVAQFYMNDALMGRDKALQNLERVKGRPLGVILDGVSRKGEGKYYGSEYRYDTSQSPRQATGGKSKAEGD